MPREPRDSRMRSSTSPSTPNVGETRRKVEAIVYWRGAFEARGKSRLLP
jgi:hypothetical protein